MPSRSVSPVVVDALGIPVGIAVDALDAATRTAVREAWSGALSTRGTAPRAMVVPAASLDPGPMLAALSGAVTLKAIEERRGHLWMLHAAGVAGPDGGVVVLVGPSGAGKTTAIRVLAEAAGYVSDETVAIDPTGTVLPYRKPLSLITDGVAHKVQRSPKELGLGGLPSRTLRLSRIVLLDRRSEPTPARLVPVRVSEAIATLAGQSSGLVHLSRPVRTMAALIERTGGALRAEYSEARDLAAVVHALLDTGIPSTTMSPADRPLLDDAQPAVGGAGPRYARAETVDWHPLSDETLAVLTAHADGSGMLRILAGVAPMLWQAANGVSRDDLIAAVDAEFGCPDPGGVTDRALASLVDAGLVRVSG